MKIKNLIPFLLLLTMTAEIKAQQGINIANESEINTSFQEYSPAFYKGGLVFITSNPAVVKIKQPDDNTGKGTTSIFLSKLLDNGMLSKPSPFAESLTTSFYDGPLCFNPDGTIVYFTRSNIKNNKPIKAKDGLVKLKIYSAHLKGEKWGDIVELPFNNKEYDFTHPSVSPDGRRLYFASNRPGGFGGMDLYVTTLIDNKWSEPVNLGPKINTSKDEIFPFIHADGKVFYSSNGRAKNVGGLDIYFTAKTDTGWLMPHLLPEPLNSRSDDFGLILSPDKMSGYFSSNRSSGKGDDDIFSFSSPQVIDYEVITNNELSNTEGVEAKNNNEAKTDLPVGEVKSIEKTNDTTVENVKSTPLKDTVAEVQTQFEKAKSELIKLENPIVESAKIDVPLVEKPVEKSVEKAKEEVIVSAPIIEPVKEIVAINEPSNSKKPIEKAKEEVVVSAPIIEPVKEIVAINEPSNSKKPIEKAKEEVVVSAPIVEPVKEIVAINEPSKSEKPFEKAKEEVVVSAPIIEPVKENLAVKEDVKSEMPAEKTKVETVVSTPVSDKIYENTLASNKPSDVKMAVSTSVKKETNGGIRCKFLVVAGTYADEKNAIIQQKIVKNKGYADVEVIHYKDKNLYGVCIKQSNDEKEAYSVAKNVVKGGIDAFVKVLK